ncbi:MAG: hypothetical protein ACE5OS_02460 [Anaerolineae bacterium]
MGYPYDHSYSPPIPTLEIALRLSGNDASVGPLRAIVDSGADATLIPTSHLGALGARAWAA